MNEAEAKILSAAVTMLARRGIPTDVQELLVRGNPGRGIPPGALTLAVYSAIGACGDIISLWRAPTHRHADGGLYTLQEQSIHVKVSDDNWAQWTLYTDSHGRLFATSPARWAERFAPISGGD